MRYWHFNSIKVQLEHRKLQCNSEGLQNFNSIKVQLERTPGRQWVRSSSRFQFHKGTIRTIIFLDERIALCNFNSIKVQLELCHRPPEG